MKTYLSIAIIIIIIIINKSYHSAVSYIKNFGNNNERQVAQLSKRDRAAGWVSFGTNFADSSIFNHCDVICLTMVEDRLIISAKYSLPVILGKN